MKNLKVKSILFSLLAIMAVAVFMTSCEQGEVIEDATNDLPALEQQILDLDNLPENFQLVEVTDGSTMEERGCYCGISTLDVLSNKTIARYNVEANRSFYISYTCGGVQVESFQLHNYQNYCRTINLVHYHNHNCYDLCGTGKMGVGRSICAIDTDCC